MNMLRKWWQFLLVVFRRSPAPPLIMPVQAPPLPFDANKVTWTSQPGASAPDPVPLLAMDIPPPPDEQAQIAKHNRAIRRKLDAERRALEKARRKHDKFVEPQGPQPVKHERAEEVPKPKAKPVPVPEEDVFDDPNDQLIVDEWIEGDGEDVLYEETEFMGEFNFRDTILDQLDRYWVYLERMKKHDPNAYGFYKQLGATLVPYARTGSHTDKPHQMRKIEDIEAYKKQIVLSSWFRQNWPAFGCIAFGTNPRDEAAETAKLPDGHTVGIPKFIYFRRVERMPWTVQPVRGGKLYMLTVWWDRVEPVDRVRYKWGRPNEFPIQISDDGSRIRILKTRKRNDGSGTRPWWDWRIPHHYTEWSKQYGLDAQTHLSHLFCDAMRDLEYASYSMLRVEISKGDLTAVFGLNPRRTPYFFQDRDIVLTQSGRKKRVFHMVRSFVDKNGVVHPTQFRGLRDFHWAGYDVHITVPGRDHFVPIEFNVPAYGYQNGPKEKGKRLITDEQMATALKKLMHKNLGGTH